MKQSVEFIKSGTICNSFPNANKLCHFIILVKHNHE